MTVSDEVVLVADADIERLQNVAKRAGDEINRLRTEANRLREALERLRDMADHGGIVSPDDVIAVGLIADRSLAEAAPVLPAEPRDPVEAILAVECPNCHASAGSVCQPFGSDKTRGGVCMVRIRAAEQRRKP